jgi:hypothetical protein
MMSASFRGILIEEKAAQISEIEKKHSNICMHNLVSCAFLNHLPPDVDPMKLNLS